MNDKEIFAIILAKDKKETWKEFNNYISSIEDNNGLYEYFDEILLLLDNKKSYIRLRGFIIICRLAKWDINNKINLNIKNILRLLDDDLPTIIRQCISSLNYLLKYKKELFIEIKIKLVNIDLSKYKDSMSPLIKKDIDKLLNDNFM